MTKWYPQSGLLQTTWKSAVVAADLALGGGGGASQLLMLVASQISTPPANP
jgi:hypothetical protein